MSDVDKARAARATATYNEVVLHLSLSETVWIETRDWLERLVLRTLTVPAHLVRTSVR